MESVSTVELISFSDSQTQIRMKPIQLEMQICVLLQ